MTGAGPDIKDIQALRNRLAALILRTPVVRCAALWVTFSRHAALDNAA